MPFFVLIGFIALAVWVYVKLKKSKWFDKFCKDLASDDTVTNSSKDNMKDISKAESDLGKQADQNKKQTEKLAKDTEGIKDFLGKRGVDDAEKDKGDS